MKLILLAAGKSSRIFNKIKVNKCLIKIKSKTLIKKLINHTKTSKIKSIDIVTGFRAKNIENELKGLKVNFIKNKNYANTDMVYSAMLSLKNTNVDVIICYTDIVVEKKIFTKLTSKKFSKITVPHLENWKTVWKNRKKKIFDDAETFITNKKNNRIIEIGKKLTNKNYKKTKGQFMGIIYIPKDIIKHVTNYYEMRDKRKIQFTEFLNFLISKKLELSTFPYKGLWYEFDDIHDLKSFN
tara:strand:- start:90 stop:809 length:720 start_codon:yes stop_codon:yes gene_type:complete